MGDTLVLSAQASDLPSSDKSGAKVFETALAIVDGQRDSSASQPKDATAITENDKKEGAMDAVDQTNANELLCSATGDVEPVSKMNRERDGTNTSEVVSHAAEQPPPKESSDEAKLEVEKSYDVVQETLRKEYGKTHPWIVDWVELDWEHFKNRYGQNEGEGRHIIEVLKVTPTTVDEIDADILRRGGELPKRPNKSDSVIVGSSWIQRIRIQSPAVISHLSSAGDVEVEYSFDRIVTFIRPFTSLRVLQPKMKLALEMAEKKWANAESSVVTAEHNTIVNEKIQTAEIPGNPEDLHPEKGSTEDYPHPGMDDRTALEHLRCYVKFVDEKVAPLYDYFQNTSHKKVRFNDLALLFTPGELVYWPSAGSIMSVPYPFYQPAWRVFHYARDAYGSPWIDDIELGPDDKFHVCCYYIDHDGNSYGVMKGRIDFECFNGEKAITDLPAYPFRFADGATRKLEELKTQGNLFRSFVREHHLYYDGWTIPQELQQKDESAQAEDSKYRREVRAEVNTTRSSPEHVESSVVVDFDEAFKRHPRWKTYFRIPREAEIEWNWSLESYELIHWKDKTRREKLYEVKEVFMTNDEAINLWKNEFIAKDIPITSSQGDGLNEVADEDIVLLPRRLIAYALRDRKFLILDIFSLRSLVQHADMFKDLKINPNHQRMVESLVKAYSERSRMQKERPLLTLNQDLVYGKGAGLFILLHGAPGVGKTATAEAVAQRYNKPLFSITCGSLGLTPREVEDELKEIFRLAHLWDCVLLLDEADVFLARRDISSLKRNALVSVFLRVLEYYSGILFLTTNRVGTIDEAFKSRIHLSLYYERLTKKQMMAIFRVNLGKLRDIEAEKAKELFHTDMKEADLIIEDDKIIKFAKRHWKVTPKHARWNGRQIRNAFQIASSMARYDTGKKSLADEKNAKDENPERLTLDNSHFELVAEIMRSFDTYFELATGETDEQAAFLDKARDDRLQDEDLVSYMRSYETPSAKGKSFRGTKVREEHSDRPRKSKGTGKGKDRNYNKEEREIKPVKTKGKATKSSSLPYEDEGRASSSRRKAASPQRKPQSSRKSITKSATKTSGVSRSSKKRRDESDEEEDEEEDSEGLDQTSYSEETDSAEEGSSEDQTDEDDDDEDSDDD